MYTRVVTWPPYTGASTAQGGADVPDMTSGKHTCIAVSKRWNEHEAS